MTSASASAPALLDVPRIRAISFDLDDTLWPIWPTIERAERVLYQWLVREAPKTAELCASPGVMRALRAATAKARSDIAHDMSALRREMLRTALIQAAEPAELADAAFDAFYAERQRVTLYEDALPALQWLSERYPLVAVSNGNADLHLTGVGRWFRASFSASSFGSGKPHAPIFHAAAASLGVQPGEVLHVGDDAALDVAGALDAGMQAAWLVRGEPPSAQDVRAHLIVQNLHALCAALDVSASVRGRSAP